MTAATVETIDDFFSEGDVPEPQPLPTGRLTDREIALYLIDNWREHLREGTRVVTNTEIAEQTGRHKANIGRALRAHTNHQEYRSRLAFLQATNAYAVQARFSLREREDMQQRAFMNGLASMTQEQKVNNARYAHQQKAQGALINGVLYGSVPEAAVVSFLQESSLQFTPIPRNTVQYQPPRKATDTTKTPSLQRHRFDVRNTRGEEFLLDYHVPQIHTRTGHDFNSAEEALLHRERIKRDSACRYEVEELLALRYEERVRTFLAATPMHVTTPFLFASCPSEIYAVFKKDLGIVTMPERTFTIEFNRRVKELRAQRT